MLFDIDENNQVVLDLEETDKKKFIRDKNWQILVTEEEIRDEFL